MDRVLASRSLAVAVTVLLLVGGFALAAWAISNIPGRAPGGDAQTAANRTDAGVESEAGAAPADADAQSRNGAQTDAESDDRTAEEADAPTPAPTATPAAPELLIALGPGVPAPLAEAINTFVISNTGYLTEPTLPSTAQLRLDIVPAGGEPVYTETFAAAVRFDEPRDDITWRDLRNSWRGRNGPYATVVVMSDTLPSLIQALGDPADGVMGVESMDDLVDATWLMTSTVAYLPFDRLTPSLSVLPVDGQTPIENAAFFNAVDYPFTATIYAHVNGDESAAASLIDAFLADLPAGNRLADRLTVVAMTGVTAMARRTAEQMDKLGATWPAEVVGSELAAADITHISNEVPFVEGCETNVESDNLVFCSKPDYLDALLAVGVDIIGLTGNHQNDFGYAAAVDSLELYSEAGLPVYGGGLNKDAAFKPLIVEHNGNRLAFTGANAYGPDFAWATDVLPGSAPFDLNILSATVRNLHAKDLADVVLVELQYIESYGVDPLFDQRTDFNAISRAGAEIVTGVQSHVAQGLEFNDGRIILYGLGNFFFDQMHDDEVRQGLVVKHTIYDGKHLATQLRPTVLEEYGQPRWATPEEVTLILERVFDASRWEY